MQANALRTSLRDEVKLDAPSSSSENRGVRAWSSVELPGRHWIQARRTELGANGEYETRQWLTCDFIEALRFGRGEGVARFSLFVGIFTPRATPGYLFGEIVELLKFTGVDVFVVRFGSGVSVTVGGQDNSLDVSHLKGFESLYQAETWRAAD